MIQIAPRASAALHAPSHTARQRLAISTLFRVWTDEGYVREVTRALTLPYGRIVIFATGDSITEGRLFSVGVDRDGSVWAL